MALSISHEFAVANIQELAEAKAEKKRLMQELAVAKAKLEQLAQVIVVQEEMIMLMRDAAESDAKARGLLPKDYTRENK